VFGHGTKHGRWLPARGAEGAEQGGAPAQKLPEGGGVAGIALDNLKPSIGQVGFFGVAQEYPDAVSRPECFPNQRAARLAGSTQNGYG